MFIAGYENNKPVLCHLSINVERYRLVFTVVPTEPAFADSDTHVQVIGYYNHIIKLFPGYKFSNNHLDDLIKMISLEARYEPYVDSSINYVIIKPTGFKYGKNY